MSETTLAKPEMSGSHAESAYSIIEEMIVTLQFSPGQVLTEKTLCEVVQLGRTPVREALLRLSQDHLLTVLPRQGVMVRPIETVTALEALEVRYRIEGLLIERATRLATEVERYRFEVLADNAETAIGTQDSKTFALIDKRFNALVAEASRHAVAAKAVMPLHAVSRRVGFFLAQFSGRGLVETGLPHVEIMRAISACDVERALAALEKLHDRTRTQTLSIEAEGLLDQPFPHRHKL